MLPAVVIRTGQHFGGATYFNYSGDAMKYITRKAWVMSVDEDSVLLFAGVCWRVWFESFVEEPKKNQAVWLEVDNLWEPDHVRVYPRGNYWLRRHNEESLA